MSKVRFIRWTLLLISVISVNTMNAQTADAISAQQQRLSAISALTATGDLENLKTQLNAGLDAGLTINEIKDALVQLYAYCGFPRSLNALTLFMNVVEERKKAGKTDVEGREASPLPADMDMLRTGTEVQTAIVGQPVGGGVMDFAPAIDRYLKEHLFGAIFASDVLNHQQREIVTVAALTVILGAEGQLQAHLDYAMNTGLTKNQLAGILDVVEKTIGKEQADKGRATLDKIK